MDFNTLDSRKAADEGRPLHLVHPSNGKPLFDNDEGITVPNDKPCRVWVTGSESHAAQKAIRDVLRNEVKTDKASDDPFSDENSAEFQHGRLVRLASPLITKFENIKRGDKLATAPDDVEWFLNLQLTNDNRDEKSFAEQVSAFSVKRGNYLGN